MWTVLWDTNLPLLQWGVVVGASTVAAVWDVLQHRIPNLLTGPLFISGLIWSVWVGGWAGLGDSFFACVVMAAPYVWLFLVAGGGAGDAKMMGAIGAWLGLANGLAALVCVSIAGVIIGVVFLIRRRGIACVFPLLIVGLCELSQRFFLRSSKPKQNPPQKGEPLAKMPYGLAIWAGVCLAAAGVALWRLQT